MMGEMRAKKPFYKKWWVWLIAAIIVISIAIPQEEVAEKEEAVPTAAETTDKKEEPKETAKEPEVKKNEPTMTMAEFEALENGMSYEDAVAIIGGEGEVMSESGEKGTDLYTVLYVWDGEGDIGANSNVMFQGGKLNTKAQFGLK